MPGRSGLDLLDSVKREFPGRPVLVMSMHSEELHGERVLKAGRRATSARKARRRSWRTRCARSRAAGAMSVRRLPKRSRSSSRTIHARRCTSGSPIANTGSCGCSRPAGRSTKSPARCCSARARSAPIARAS
jgi:hypothetical protein